MPKNRFFRHISGIFGRKKIFFENRNPSHFGHYHFASVCKISWKNIKHSSRYSRFTVFPAKIGCSGDFKKVPASKTSFLTIKTCSIVGVVINNVFVWKTTKYEEKNPNRIGKKRRFPAFSAGKNFFPKSDSAIFWALLIRIFVQKIRKN